MKLDANQPILDPALWNCHSLSAASRVLHDFRNRL
jgi:hypothetical protein